MISCGKIKDHVSLLPQRKLKSKSKGKVTNLIYILVKTIRESDVWFLGEREKDSSYFYESRVSEGSLPPPARPKLSFSKGEVGEISFRLPKNNSWKPLNVNNVSLAR